MYLYTDEIDFAPFGSKANRQLRIPELVSREAGAIPRPSPSRFIALRIWSGLIIMAVIRN